MEEFKIPKSKARYWVGVLYLENMLDNWQEDIGDILQYPYCYCVHDKDIVEDLNETRKNHVHIIIAFPNTTTYKNALNILDLLSADGKRAINKVESVVSIKNMYEYLIHNTETCKKKGKHRYSEKERICGNNFDIGDYIQVTTKEKQEMLHDILKKIHDLGLMNFDDLLALLTNDYTDFTTNSEIIEVVKSNSGFIERILKGRYLKYVREKEKI